MVAKTVAQVRHLPVRLLRDARNSRIVWQSQDEDAKVNAFFDSSGSLSPARLLSDCRC